MTKTRKLAPIIPIITQYVFIIDFLKLYSEQALINTQAPCPMIFRKNNIHTDRSLKNF